MAFISQIRGMLLEEAILHFLRVSGYRVVDAPGSDPTLSRCSAGLQVRGRGGLHQIDAIADYLLTPPFCYPQRLLVEAKCYTSQSHVGIEIVRNSVGVLKDVGEFWAFGGDPPLRTRYHYLSALFSASDFTEEAEKYAFAQDIYLVPLARSRYMAPIVKAISSITVESLGASSPGQKRVDLSTLRRVVRRYLSQFVNTAQFKELDTLLLWADGRPELLAQVQHLTEHIEPRDWSSYPDPVRRVAEHLYAFRSFTGYQLPLALLQFFYKCHQIPGALLGLIAQRFPILLMPSPTTDIRKLQTGSLARVWQDRHGWYLQSVTGDDSLFSFDLPLVLFEEYTVRGSRLWTAEARSFEAKLLSEIQAIVTVDNEIRLITFRLQKGWLEALRKNSGPSLDESVNE